MSHYTSGTPYYTSGTPYLICNNCGSGSVHNGQCNVCYAIVEDKKTVEYKPLPKPQPINYDQVINSQRPDTKQKGFFQRIFRRNR